MTMNYQKRFDYEVTTTAILEKLKALTDKNSFLKCTEKVIVMRGFAEDSHLCYHLQLTNRHSKPVIFNIERPYGCAFNATPHIGVVMPQCTTTIYCTFRSELIARVPDDGIHLYNIFQKEISIDEFVNAQTNKEKERVARKIWSKHRGKCLECLRLPVAFEPRRATTTHEPHIDFDSGELSVKHHIVTPKPSKEEMPTSQLPSAEEIHEGNMQ